MMIQSKIKVMAPMTSS